MAEAKLSSRKIETFKLPAGQEDAYLADGMGLYLRVYATGAKHWSYRYQTAIAGSDKKLDRHMDLGVYGSKAGQVSLAMARSMRAELKTLRKSGKDPIAEIERQEQEKLEAERQIREAKAKLDERLTVRKLFDRWYATALPHRPNTGGRPLGRKDNGASVLRLFKKDVFPEIGDKYAEEITRGQIVSLLDANLARGNTRMGTVLLSELRQMFQWAVERELLKVDPTATLKKARFGVVHAERSRRLSDDELRELRDLLPKCGMTESAQLALWLQLATCCRIGELLIARWEHVDFKARTWFKPSTKNYKSHTVYLSNFAMEKLIQLWEISWKTGWLFPAVNKSKTHIDVKTISKQVGDRQRAEGNLPLSGRSQATRSLVLSGGRWTPHDLRRTGASISSELSQRPHLVEKMLSHTEQNKMKRTYQRSDDSRELMSIWRMLGEKLETTLQDARCPSSIELNPVCSDLLQA